MDKNIKQLFARQSILVIGDLILDEYIFGNVQRISPEAPIPIVETSHRDYRAGGAGNVAMNIAEMGGIPLLCGVSGNDDAAEKMKLILAKRMLTDNILLLNSDDRPTTLKSRVIAHSQQMLRIDNESCTAISSTCEKSLINWAAQKLPFCQACVISDYAKGCITENVASAIISLARKSAIPVIVDPKGSNYQRYLGATLITPNRHEAGVAVKRTLNTTEEIDQAATELLTSLADTHLLITCGEDGMLLYRNSLPKVHIPAKKRPVFDVTGAGDTVVSVLALALAAGMEIVPAATIANIAGSIAVEKLGAQPISIAELLAEL